jgi:polyhydroxyalkanoate synthesis regulator phasin
MTNKQWVYDLTDIEIATVIDKLVRVGDIEPNEAMKEIVDLLKQTYSRYHFLLFEKAFDAYLIGSMSDIHRVKKINAVFLTNIINRFIKDVKVPRYNPFEKAPAEVVYTDEEVYQQGITTLKHLKNDFIKAYWEHDADSRLSLVLLKIGYDFVTKHKMYEADLVEYDTMKQWLYDFEQRKNAHIKRNIENENKHRQVGSIVDHLMSSPTAIETLDKATKMALILKSKTNENGH